MGRKLLSILAVLILLAAVIYGLAITRAYVASILLFPEFSGVFAGPPICKQLEVDASLSSTVISENDNTTLTVKLNNKSHESCTTVVELLSTNFDVSPSETNQLVNLDSQQSASVVWLLSPRKSGNFRVAIRVDQTDVPLGIVVTNILGLTPFQAQILSVLGTVIGPALTIPWWYERLKERKRKRKKKNSKKKRVKRR